MLVFHAFLFLLLSLIVEMALVLVGSSKYVLISWPLLVTSDVAAALVMTVLSVYVFVSIVRLHKWIVLQLLTGLIYPAILLVGYVINRDLQNLDTLVRTVPSQIVFQWIAVLGYWSFAILAIASNVQKVPGARVLLHMAALVALIGFPMAALVSEAGGRVPLAELLLQPRFWFGLSVVIGAVGMAMGVTEKSIPGSISLVALAGLVYAIHWSGPDSTASIILSIIRAISLVVILFRLLAWLDFGPFGVFIGLTAIGVAFFNIWPIGIVGAITIVLLVLLDLNNALTRLSQMTE